MTKKIRYWDYFALQFSAWSQSGLVSCDVVTIIGYWDYFALVPCKVVTIHSFSAVSINVHFEGEEETAPLLRHLCHFCPHPSIRYKFSVRSPSDPWPTWSGVKHGSELEYVFGRPIAESAAVDGASEFDVRDASISRFIIESWSNFVKNG